MFRVGGPADVVITLQTADEIQQALAMARELGAMEFAYDYSRLHLAAAWGGRSNVWTEGRRSSERRRA